MGSKRKVKLGIEKYNNATFHMPHLDYYICALRKIKRHNHYYCRCRRDNSVRNIENCNRRYPFFKARFRDRLKACWYILTKGFKFI